MSIATLIAATRPAFLSVTLVGVILGLCSASAEGSLHSPLLAIITLIFALVSHAGANVINDYYDSISGCDEANVDRIFPFTGGSRFIQNGLLSTTQTAIFGYTLLAIVIPAGIYLMNKSGPALIAIGLAGLFLGLAYSAKPLALQSRGIGEIVITLAWTLVVVGTDYVQRGQFSQTALLAGFAYALLVANVLFVNQIPDRIADATTGKRTLIVRFGAGISPWGSSILYLSASLVLGFAIIANALPLASAIALGAVIPASQSLRRLFLNPIAPEQLRLAIPKAIQSCLIFGILLSAGLLLNGLDLITAR
ncbi:MAG: prenyltransferase [Fluviibacter sp.]|jgi:1,4-dihydroxy-2-naphthoate octaprenyltransferase